MTSAPALTRVMVALAWTSLAAVLTSALLPEPGGVLGTLLIGAVALAGLRGPSRIAGAAGAVAGALLVCAGVALAVAGADPAAALAGPVDALLSPAFGAPGTWLPALVSAALVVATAPLAGWTAAGLASGAALAAGGLPPPRPAPPPVPRRVELAELVRAAGDGRELALALFGIDGGGDEAFAMALLDEALAAGLGGQDAVCAYGLTERLVMLAGVTASVLRARAAQLCAAGTDLSGRPVRAALATYPADGATLHEVLDRLQRDLAACRAQGAIVASG